MSSFAPRKPQSKDKSSPTKSFVDSVVKTIREREGDVKSKEIEALRAENEMLRAAVLEQEDLITNASDLNNQLTNELDGVKKEYADLEKSFEESVQIMKQMKAKLTKEQDEKQAIQTDLLSRIHILEGMLADSREAHRLSEMKAEDLEHQVASKPAVEASAGKTVKSALAPEHVHQYHLHLRDTLKVIADRLVEGLLRLDGDIESTAPLVNAVVQTQKDQIPLSARTRSPEQDSFMYGKPSSTYAVAGTQIVEGEGEDGEEEQEEEEEEE